eukprot:Nitzschia sp. Nitz4//scaffold204_size40132//37510//37963//NITZ4_007548-RA/size40132-snap-gene-0.6-mRNA-1//-1//CDS//3329541491//3223//frame0
MSGSLNHSFPGNVFRDIPKPIQFFIITERHINLLCMLGLRPRQEMAAIVVVDTVVLCMNSVIAFVAAFQTEDKRWYIGYLFMQASFVNDGGFQTLHQRRILPPLWDFTWSVPYISIAGRDLLL